MKSSVIKYAKLWIKSLTDKSLIKYFLGISLAGLFYSASNALISIRLKALFNIIEQGMNRENGMDNIEEYLVLLGMVMVLSQIFAALHNALIEISSYKIMRKYYSMLQEKAKVLSPIFFENSKNLNKIEKAKDGVESLTFTINVILLLLTYYFPYFIMMTIFLSSINFTFSITILLIFIPVIFSHIYKGRVFKGFVNNSVEEKRRYKHYEDCMVDIKFLKETRMLSATDFFEKKYKNSLEKFCDSSYKAMSKTVKYELVMKSFTLLGYVLILALFLTEMLENTISVGTFGALFTAIHRMFMTAEQLVYGHIGNIAKNSGSIANFFAFLNIEDTKKKGYQNCNNRENCFELDNVSFSYPNTKKPTISSINLNIKEKEVIAIVGENGAGKSTLAKIIAGVYEETAGTIRKSSGVKIKKGMDISMVQQNYQKYELSLKENIIISDTENYDKDKLTELCDKLRIMGINKRTYSNGLDTVLSKKFGGIDVSGGQWQKIAIARAQYKEHEILILDEPMAAIDPIDEKNLYDYFLSMISNKTAIVVTHRLALTRLADKIIVLKSGKIVEMGTHSELMKQNGAYNKMFNSQKKLYS